MASTARVSGNESHKVAYLVLSHQYPRQVRRLIDRLLEDDPDGYVVVQHDPAGGTLDLSGCADPARAHLLTTFSVRRWGNYALVGDLLQAISWALTHLEIGWVTVLSGQDYPLRSLAGFGAELGDSGFDAFLSARIIPLQRPNASDSAALYAHARYYYRWYRLPAWLLGWSKGRSIDRLVAGALRRLSGGQPFIFVWPLPRGAGEMIGVRRPKLPFSDEFPCYMGSQWLTMSRRAASLTLDFLARCPDLEALYRRSIIPDESLLVTILCNTDGLRVRDSNHHFIRMVGAGQSHAAVLEMADLAELRTSGQRFARKFDERVDSDVLDELDREAPAAGH